MRYSRKDAESAFEQLCVLLGKSTDVTCSTARTANGTDLERHEARGWRWNVGAWRLDYNGAYGGYQVQEIFNDSGGVSCPLGDLRRTAREFCESVYFVRRALEVR